jgi:hypothetical protein
MLSIEVRDFAPQLAGRALLRAILPQVFTASLSARVQYR